MNWWDILKATWDPNNPNQLMNIEQGQATSGNIPPRTQGQSFSNIAQRTPQQNNPNQSPRLHAQPSNQPINTDTAVGNQQVQAGQAGQTDVTSFQKPITTQVINQTPQQDTSSADAGGEDDSDVGDIRQNKEEARQNLVQQPKGAYAAELTEIINILSRTVTDPANQRDAAVEAKRKLHEIFPSSMA